MTVCIGSTACKWQQYRSKSTVSFKLQTSQIVPWVDQFQGPQKAQDVSQVTQLPGHKQNKQF